MHAWLKQAGRHESGSMWYDTLARPQMYEHILVAVGTRADSITLEAAIRLARETGARLTALHVVDPVPPYAGVDTYDFSVTLEAFDAYGRAVAERCVAAIHQAG